MKEETLLFVSVSLKEFESRKSIRQSKFFILLFNPKDRGWGVVERSYDLEMFHSCRTILFNSLEAINYSRLNPPSVKLFLQFFSFHPPSSRVVEERLSLARATKEVKIKNNRTRDEFLCYDDEKIDIPSYL